MILEFLCWLKNSVQSTEYRRMDRIEVNDEETVGGVLINLDSTLGKLSSKDLMAFLKYSNF